MFIARDFRKLSQLILKVVNLSVTWNKVNLEIHQSVCFKIVWFFTCIWFFTSTVATTTTMSLQHKLLNDSFSVGTSSFTTSLACAWYEIQKIVRAGGLLLKNECHSLFIKFKPQPLGSKSQAKQCCNLWGICKECSSASLDVGGNDARCS